MNNIYAVKESFQNSADLKYPKGPCFFYDILNLALSFYSRPVCHHCLHTQALRTNHIKLTTVTLWLCVLVCDALSAVKFFPLFFGNTWQTPTHFETLLKIHSHSMALPKLPCNF